MARGGSAGGLLMGAVANLAPELFRAIVAEVPFVDCLTTILDDTLPLTVLEWEEWGNPVDDPEIYRVMKSYSPYDNVRPVDDRGEPVRYPDILATAGLSDPRVGFWEPAKWVAKLRAANPENRVLLKTELGAGHGGPSGRYDAWKDEAFVYAFILDALGLVDVPPTGQPAVRTNRPVEVVDRTPGRWSTGWSSGPEGWKVATNGRVRRASGSTTGTPSTDRVAGGRPELDGDRSRRRYHLGGAGLHGPGPQRRPVEVEVAWTQHGPEAVTVTR